MGCRSGLGLHGGAAGGEIAVHSSFRWGYTGGMTISPFICIMLSSTFITMIATHFLMIRSNARLAESVDRIRSLATVIEGDGVVDESEWSYQLAIQKELENMPPNSRA